MESNFLSRLQELQPVVRAVARQWSRDCPAEEPDLVQEMALTVWMILSRRPDAPREYLAAAVRNTALSYRRRGVSVDRLYQRRHLWHTESLDALLDEDPDGDRGRLPAQRRDGASPVEDIVVARFLYAQLRQRLTARETAFLELRLQGFSPEEAGDLLGLRRSQRDRVGTRLRAKARALWETEGPVPGTAYATVREAARELGVTPTTVYYYCQHGILEGARLVRRCWLIPRPLRLPDYAVPGDPALATVAEAAQELCLSPVTVAQFCRGGKIQGAYREGRQWRIPRPVQLRKVEGQKDCATAQEAATELGLKPVTIALLCRQGKFPGACLKKGHWLIPRPVKRLPGGQKTGGQGKPAHGKVGRQH